jgi:hypothetical protein
MIPRPGFEPAAERRRLAEVREKRVPWWRWGPYLAERQWGTVREDYSPYGTAWDYFPHDHARSRAYRWGEDGLLGICDNRGRLCFALALWNEADPILKERLFGLTGSEGNHGEDVKEYYYFLDSTPTHSYMKALYKYPQRAFPYADLVAQNRRRGREQPEYELVDTGIFSDGRYFDVVVGYAKADPTDVVIRVSATNRGPDPAPLHLLPTLWFRNTWAWGWDNRRPELRVVGSEDGRLVRATHSTLGEYWWACEGTPDLLFTENESNAQRLWGAPNRTPHVKDGINDAVVNGRTDAVNPEGVGTRVAAHYTFAVAPGATETVTLRLSDRRSAAPFADAADVLAVRQAEADSFFCAFGAEQMDEDARRVQRQAFAGLLWSKQYYHYDVDRWLDGDPGQPVPPAQRRAGRNAGWTHVHASDVILMPDDWEYPWFAAWDLAFHTMVAAHVDPWLAKQQLLLLTSEWYMNPRGQLPAYEYDFGDVNPPVHALAALRVFFLDGGRDLEWLTKIFNKLLVNFTWWMNRVDVDGKDLFAGGFLGLDNIAPFDRNHPPDLGGRLVEVDGTAWVALFELGLLGMAVTLAAEEPAYEDIAVKFFEHFWAIALAMDSQGLWDEEDGAYYSAVHTDDGGSWPIRAHSIDGVLALAACAVPEEKVLDKLPELRRRLDWFAEHHGYRLDALADFDHPGPTGRRLMSVFGRRRLERMLPRLLDETEFLSPFGIRAVSRRHAEHPLDLGPAGRLDYEPGESRSGMFGGNSNWRGPIWFPMNYLVLNALARLDSYFGPDFTVEMPTGSGRRMRLLDVSRSIGDRLVSIFRDGPDHRRPVFDGSERQQTDPDWHDQVLFYEYFHGDTGAGLGAAHQTGWTALVADLITSRRFDSYVAPHR